MHWKQSTPVPKQTTALEGSSAPANTIWAKQIQGSRAVKPSPFTRSFCRIYSPLPRTPALIQNPLASLLLFAESGPGLSSASDRVCPPHPLCQSLRQGGR